MPDVEDSNVPANQNRLLESGGGHQRPATALSWALFLLAVLAALFGVGLAQSAQVSGSAPIRQGPTPFLTNVVLSAGFAGVGLLLRLTRRDLPIGWFFQAIGCLAGLALLAWGYVQFAVAERVTIPLTAADAAWLNVVVTMPAWLTVLLWLVICLPEGYPADRRSTRLMVVAATTAIGFGVAIGLNPGPLPFHPFLDNPRGIAPASGSIVRLGVALTGIGLVGCALASFWSVVRRYRRAEPLGRRQIKWFAYGGALSLAGLFAFVAFGPGVYATDPARADLMYTLAIASAMSLPVVAVAAILRHNLYDIDRLIIRTVVLAVLTGLLTGLYTLSIRLFNGFIVDLTGLSPEEVLVLTTLLIAVTFATLRQGVEALVNRYVNVPRSAGSAAEAEAVHDGPASPELIEQVKLIAREAALEVLADATMATSQAHAAAGPIRHAGDGPTINAAKLPADATIASVSTERLPYEG